MGLMRLWFASIMTSCDLGCEMIQKYYDDDITSLPLMLHTTLPLYILSTLGHIKRRVWERKSNMYLSYWDGPYFQTANWHEITWRWFRWIRHMLDTFSLLIGQCWESSYSDWLILTSSQVLMVLYKSQTTGGCRLKPRRPLLCNSCECSKNATNL